MKFTDWLRKLGIFRSGKIAKTYTSGKDLPIEFVSSGVFDREKDIMLDLDKRKPEKTKSK